MASSSPAHQSKRLTLKMLNTGLNLSSTLSGPGAMSFLFSTIVGAPKLGYTITTIYQRSCSPKKLYGIYPCGLTTNFPSAPARRFDDRYFIPQSRYTRVDDNKIDADPRLEVLSRSAENGINICSTSDMRHILSCVGLLNMTEIPCRMNSSVKQGP